MNVLYAFLTSCIGVLLLTPIIKRISSSLGYLAYPKQDRWHSKPTALFGGVGIFIAALTAYLIFTEHSLSTWGLVAAFEFIFLVGFVDDVIHIKPYTKLLGQIIASCILVYFGFYIKGLHPSLAIPLTVFWVVGIVNAVNLLDNMDGLASGIACISSGTLCVYSLLVGNMPLALISAVIAGATLGFLRYNFHPAKIFMGDCGSQFIGFVLASCAIMGTAKHVSNLIIALAMPVVILSIPIFDTIFVTVARTLHAKPISQGGKDHTSHRLVALGLPEPKAVGVLYGISFIACVLALLNTQMGPLVMLVLMGFFVVVLIVFGMFLGEVKIYSEEEAQKAALGVNGSNVVLNGFILHKRRALEVLLDFIIICSAYVGAFLLRYEGVISEGNANLIATSLPIIIALKSASFFYFGLYRGVWRYVSVRDLVDVFKAVSVGSLLSVLALTFLFRFQGYSRTAFVIDWLLLMVGVSGIRVMQRIFTELFGTLPKGGKKLLIMGAGDAGELALREIRRNSNLRYETVGFLDDDKKKHGRVIHGIPVIGTRKDIGHIIQRDKIEEILVAIPSLDQDKLLDMFEECSKYKIRFRHMSTMFDLVPSIKR